MTKQQAQEKGYTFSGYYDTDRAAIKDRAAHLRAEGHSAVMVTVPPSRYSRGGGCEGYSIYWKENKSTTPNDQQKEARANV